MSNHVQLVVAAYRSGSLADEAFQIVRGPDQPNRSGHLAGAVLEKGSDGELTVIRRHDGDLQPQWHATLLGAALTVLATPLGILVLASTVADPAEWTGAGAVVSRLWHDIPRNTLRRMSDVLEETQTSLVLVAVDRDDITGLLLGPSPATVLTASFDVDAQAPSPD